MGGEVILKVSKPVVPDAKRALKRIFEPGEDPKILFSQAPALDGMDKNTAGCWVEWPNNWGKNVVMFGYSANILNGEWALALALEFTRRFKCVRCGWDSVGFCKDFFEAKPFGYSISNTRQMQRRYKNALKNPDSASAQKLWTDYATGIWAQACKKSLNQTQAKEEVAKMIEFDDKQVEWYRKCQKTYTKAAKDIFARLDKEEKA